MLAFFGSKLGIGLAGFLAVVLLLSWHTVSINGKDKTIAKRDNEIVVMKKNAEIEDLQAQIATKDALLKFSSQVTADLMDMNTRIKTGDTKIRETSKVQRTAAAAFVANASKPAALADPKVSNDNLTKMRAYVNCLQTSRTTGVTCVAPK